MDLTTLERNKTICTCKYCGFKCVPWQQHIVYEADFDEKSKYYRFRTTHTLCPKCITIDTFEYEETDEIHNGTEDLNN